MMSENITKIRVSIIIFLKFTQSFKILKFKSLKQIIYWFFLSFKFPLSKQGPNSKETESNPIFSFHFPRKECVKVKTSPKLDS